MKKRNNAAAQIQNLNAIGSSKWHNIILCILPLLFMIFARITKLTSENDVKILMRLALCGVGGLGVYLAYRGKLTAGHVVIMILAAGIIVRSGYTVYTNAFTRSYDVGVNSSTGVGHWGYLYHVINGHLPPSNEYQFYQPPLFYFLSAAAIKISMFFTKETDWTKYLYMSQVVSCIASAVTLLFTQKIMDKLDIEKKTQIPIIALTAFYPSQILTSARMNNDSVVLMFMVLALYFTLCWHKSMDIKYIICIAITIGCAMMTKINGAMTAFVTGPIMIYHFVECIKSKDSNKIKNIIVQLAVFAIICFPLGLWYPIRNYIEFKQPLNFVHILGTNSVVYTGDASFAERWIKIPFNFKKTPFMNMKDDASIPMAVIKTGVHGEFSYENFPSLIAWGLDYVHTALLLLTGIAVVFVMICYKKKDKTQKFAPFWVWALIGGSYIQFNAAYPYICTADFRYLLLCQMAGAFFIGYLIEYCNKHKEEKIYRYTMRFSVVLTTLFCVMSVMHFC